MSMTSVNMKYLKDENGNIISPVTSASSVYTEEGISVESEFTKRGNYLIWGNSNQAVDTSIDFGMDLSTTSFRYLDILCRLGSPTEQFGYFNISRLPIEFGRTYIFSTNYQGSGGVVQYIYTGRWTLNSTGLSYVMGNFVVINATNSTINGQNISNIAIIHVDAYYY